jgi:hypothetical protein
MVPFSALGDFWDLITPTSVYLSNLTWSPLKILVKILFVTVSLGTLLGSIYEIDLWLNAMYWDYVMKSDATSAFEWSFLSWTTTAII